MSPPAKKAVSSAAFLKKFFLAGAAAASPVSVDGKTPDALSGVAGLREMGDGEVGLLLLMKAPGFARMLGVSPGTSSGEIVSALI